MQVESGGDEDIDLNVFDPRGKVVMRELRSSGNIDHGEDHDDEQHEGSAVKVTEGGHYKICISNRFSTVTSKRVYMDVGPVVSVKYNTQPESLPAQDVESMGVSALFFLFSSSFLSPPPPPCSYSLLGLFSSGFAISSYLDPPLPNALQLS